MAPWLLAALLLPCVWQASTLASRAQGAAPEWQARAVQKYPDLGVRGSALNQRFVAAVAARRQATPAFFADPRWPLLLADELAGPVGAPALPPPAPAALPPPPAAPAPARPNPPPAASPPAAAAADYDAGAPPAGSGLSSAKFRWWSPPATAVRGVLVILEGRGGDSRGMVGKSEWQGLAAQTHFGLVGAQLVNPPDDPYTFQGDAGGVISELLNKAVRALLAQAGQKAADLPLAFWGHSAGGNVTQQYMSRHANRVAGAVLMRATAGPGALAPGKDDVPTLICVGGKDKPDWVQSALANYEKGRKLRADWTLALNPGEGHEVGRTQALAIAYLGAAIGVRLPLEAGSAGLGGGGSPATLLRLSKQAGWLGDPASYEVAPYDKFTGKKQDAIWLPDEASARAWQAYLRGA